MGQRLSWGTWEDTSHKGDGNNRLQRIAEEQIPGSAHTSTYRLFLNDNQSALNSQATVTFILTVAPHVSLFPTSTPLSTPFYSPGLSVLHGQLKTKVFFRIEAGSRYILSCACLWGCPGPIPTRKEALPSSREGGQLSPSGSASVAGVTSSKIMPFLGSQASRDHEASPSGPMEPTLLGNIPPRTLLGMAEAWRSHITLSSPLWPLLPLAL